MLDPQQTVADIVLDHSECVPVFQKHRIDFCCKGQMRLVDACAQRGVDLERITADLTQAIATRVTSQEGDARTLSTAELIDRIIATHHGFLRDALPTVSALANKVARVHGGGQPYLRELNDTVQTLCGELQPHLEHQEQKLFPQLLEAKAGNEPLERDLGAMSDDHERVGALLGKIRDLTSDFSPPPHACNSYRALFAELHAVENDVLRHVHLENSVLRPRFTRSQQPKA